MSHPAKGHISMWEEMVLRYSKEGDTVLDPMAGIGTSLVAALLGRNIICVELEEHFVVPMRASWAKMSQHPMLGHAMGNVLILRGDARALPLGAADSIITSPPYADQNPHHGGGHTDFSPIGGIRHEKVIQGGYTRPQAIVTSPPYQVEAPGLPSGTGAGAVQGQHGKGYTRPQVDSIVSSPPYEEGLGHAGTPSQRDVDKKLWGRVAQNSYNNRQGENIGNLRSDAYWSAMRQVYAECYRVLAPGGIMALVLKGYTRAGVYVNLPDQTRALVESLGFVQFDEWRRELWSLSFWRILQKRRDPAAFDDRLNYESVLAFRKP